MINCLGIQVVSTEAPHIITTTTTETNESTEPTPIATLSQGTK